MVSSIILSSMLFKNHITSEPFVGDYFAGGLMEGLKNDNVNVATLRCMASMKPSRVGCILSTILLDNTYILWWTIAVINILRSTVWRCV